MITKSQVKYIQSLGHKKFRDEENVFIVEGPKIVAELIRSPNTRIRQLYATKEWVAPVALPAKSASSSGPRAALPVEEVTPSELERLSGLSTPNQVLAVFEKPVFPASNPGTSLSLILDGIQDPGNMGTIVRIADWFGVQQVLASNDSADVFNPKAIQSTMGSISRVPVIYEDVDVLLARYPDLPLYAAVLEGNDLYQEKRIRRGAIIIGNESKGVRPALLARATHRITIPRVGEAESLNAAVATGIILSHLVG